MKLKRLVQLLILTHQRTQKKKIKPHEYFVANVHEFKEQCSS